MAPRLERDCMGLCVYSEGGGPLGGERESERETVCEGGVKNKNRG